MITIENIVVQGNAKVKENFLGQTWIYALCVHKNKKENYLIYRKYSEIYDLHNRLSKDYPSSMGYRLPQFPKSHIYESRRVASERINDLSNYFDQLLKCEFCSACLPLKDFLFKTATDENRHLLYQAEKKEQGILTVEIGSPVANKEYTLEQDWNPNEFSDKRNLLCPLKAGDKVFVIDKTEAGWWLAAPSGRMDMTPGYIQASCVDTAKNDTIQESQECNEPCIVSETYVAQQDDELTVVKGEKVTATLKICDGWWLVKRGNNEGMVPMINLTVGHDQQKPKRRQSVGRRTQRRP